MGGIALLKDIEQRGKAAGTPVDPPSLQDPYRQAPWQFKVGKRKMESQRIYEREQYLILLFYLNRLEGI